MTQRITDRHSSHYVSTLSIKDYLANHVATYTVIVGNSLGYVQKDITLQGYNSNTVMHYLILYPRH